MRNAFINVALHSVSVFFEILNLTNPSNGCETLRNN
jgi:hypothetical protein